MLLVDILGVDIVDILGRTRLSNPVCAILLLEWSKELKNYNTMFHILRLVDCCQSEGERERGREGERERERKEEGRKEGGRKEGGRKEGGRKEGGRKEGKKGEKRGERETEGRRRKSIMYLSCLSHNVVHLHYPFSPSSRFSLPFIPSGLNHGLVQRQRSTWEKVPSKHRKSMEVREIVHTSSMMRYWVAHEVHERLLFRRSFNSICTCLLFFSVLLPFSPLFPHLLIHSLTSIPPLPSFLPRISLVS